MLARCREKPKKTSRRVVEAFRKVFRKPSGSGFRGSARNGEPLDGACGTRRASGTESTASRTASGSRLAPHQAATTVRHILSGCPDQLSLPLRCGRGKRYKSCCPEKFDLQISVWTVGRYLRTWGLTHRSRCDERTNKSGRGTEWLAEEYPSIRELARQFKAQIHWLDEMGLVRTIKQDDPTDVAGRRR